MEKLSLRKKSVICGLYLSKFDLDGLNQLDFENFSEAFNAIGFSLGISPASIKNYRDEFDPLFPNPRQGWHKREMRGYCRAIYEEFNALNIVEYAKLLKQIICKDSELDLLMEEVAARENEVTAFAKRLITGQAAEQYFTKKYQELEIFRHFELEDKTKYGCGFDFRLVAKEQFIVIEVKGISGKSGNVTMTQKEYSVASILRDKYFLFVVKNFREHPVHEVFCDPVNSGLIFEKNEQQVTQINWATKV